MPSSAFAKLVAPLAFSRTPWLLLLAACSSSDEPAVALEPLYCRADCEHCDTLASDLIGILPLPPPRLREEPIARAAISSHAHCAVIEVRSHEGIPATNARVELWRHRRRGKPTLVGATQTDVDGIAWIPFDGRGVFCVHAEHPDVGATANPPRQLRLSSLPQDWNVELVLPEGEVVLQRAGVAQIGIAAPDGLPLPLARVAVWRHEFGAAEPILAGMGLTDENGAVRIELDRPALYAVAAAHADYASDSLHYAWYVPRSPRGEAPANAKDESRRFVECDAHLRLGADGPTGLRAPFHEHHLGPEDDLQVTETPACCRAWFRAADDSACRKAVPEPPSRIEVARRSPDTRKPIDPPAILRTDHLVSPFSSNTSSNGTSSRIDRLEAHTHATVRHR